MGRFPLDFGRYKLTGMLGAGGTAQVFRAETLPVAGVTRPVAIKVIHRTATAFEEAEQMLVDEARIWVRLQHPNIVTVLEFGEHDGDWFLALELIDGMSAEELVRRSGALPAPLALTIGERVARALEYSHRLKIDGAPLGIVHRDVKPANILLSTNGETKLTDFGIAHARDRLVKTEVGIVKGTPHFFSPEQARGETLDGRSDLFSLGCTIHHLLTGSPLITRSDRAGFEALAAGEVPAPPAHFPEPLRALLASLTRPDAKDRPASAADAARAIRALLAPETPDDLEIELGRSVQRALGHAPTGPAARAFADGGVGAGSGAGAGGAGAGMATPGTTEPGMPPKFPASVPEILVPADGLPLSLASASAPKIPGVERSLESRTPTVSRARAPRALGFMALAVVLAAAGGWLERYRRCASLDAGLVEASAGRPDLAAAAAAADRPGMFCGDAPRTRITRSIARARAGAPPPAAAEGLGDTPAERRALAAIRGSLAASDAPTVLAEPEGRCLAAILAYKSGDDGPLADASSEITGGGPAGSPSAAASGCVTVLHASDLLRAFDLGPARDEFERATRESPSKAAFLGLAVADMFVNEDAGVTEAMERVQTTPGDEESIAGVWIPDSWRPIAGERGHLTTAMDDETSLLELVSGDVAARAGHYDDAAAEYAKVAQRGAGGALVTARQVDLALASFHPDDAATVLTTAPQGAPTAAIRARTIRVLLARGRIDEAAAALEHVESEETRRALSIQLAEAKAVAEIDTVASDKQIPVDAPAPVAAAYKRANIGDVSGALSDLKAAVGMAHGDETLLYGCLRFTRDFGLDGEAIQVARRYLERFPTAPQDHLDDVKTFAAAHPNPK